MDSSLPAVENRNPTFREPISKDGRPTPGCTYTIPARQARAVRLETRQRLRLVNPHGTQVCDLWAFCADNALEHLSMEHVRTHLSKVTPEAGDVLVTNRRRPILKLLEDSSPGVHDTLIAACDIERYRSLGVDGYHDNCAHNLQMALTAMGCTPVAVPAPLNVWMNIPVEASGRLGWLPPVARPGDAVIIEAVVPCIVVMSACPQDRVPVNGKDRVPRELAFEVIETTAYKILTADQWTALNAGTFTGAAIDQADGFVHLSTAAQLAETLDLHFQGQHDLVIAAVDLTLLEGAVRWEPSRRGQLFPHIYTALTRDVVTAWCPLQRDSTGVVRLPG